MKVDLSTIMPRDYGLNHNVSGYTGSDSMPPCNGRQCNYFLEDTYTITKEQLNNVKVEGVLYNNRMIQFGTAKALLLRGEGLFANTP